MFAVVRRNDYSKEIIRKNFVMEDYKMSLKFMTIYMFMDGIMMFMKLIRH